MGRSGYETTGFGDTAGRGVQQGGGSASNNGGVVAKDGKGISDKVRARFCPLIHFPVFIQASQSSPLQVGLIQKQQIKTQGGGSQGERK